MGKEQLGGAGITTGAQHPAQWDRRGDPSVLLESGAGAWLSFCVC